MAQHDFIYGIHSVKTVLQTRPQDVLQLYIQSHRQDKKFSEIKQLAESNDITCEVLNTAVLLNTVGNHANHQGVVAKCRAMTMMTEKNLMDVVKNALAPMLLLLLDGVQDPHNLGACLRSANAFGVAAVIAPKDRAASVTDVVRKVACGAAEQTPFIAVSNLHRVMEALKKCNVWLVGLDAEAPLPLSTVDVKGHVGIVMGGEGDGMRRLTKEACDYLAHIPMVGSVESLNVSVATGVALYEITAHKKINF